MSAKKILVIDDDPQIRNIIVEFLQEKGFRVASAPDGGKGLQTAVEEKPDLVILDVELPDMTGFEVCRKLKDTPALRYTPVIMLTAHKHEAAELNGFQSGADDYVTKPFKPARLLARIKSSIQRSQRELNANALTHLPGNMAIVEEIEKRLASKDPFSVFYFDLNNFKGFNDRYGFLRGDKAIKLTATVLTKAFAEWKAKKAFLGHVGGDDFIGIINVHDVRPLCERILRDFDKVIPRVYDPEDRKKGKITAVNRKGKKVTFPVMGLAIAVVTNHHKNFEHPGEISEIASELKKWVKSDKQSAFLIDRRT